MKAFFSIVLLLVGVRAFSQPTQPSQVHYPQESHLKNVRQLTFGGDNAEAYWSFDGKMVSFQSNNKEWGLSCDQIFYMPIEGLDARGIAVRTGHHCTQPLMDRFGIEGTVRASFSVYNTKAEIDSLAEGVERTINFMR